eukprot:65173-Hanusia_phi.AAC.1
MRLNLLRSWHLLQLDSADVARQLTLMESRHFFTITYEELLETSTALAGRSLPFSNDDEEVFGLNGKDSLTRSLPKASPIRDFIESNRVLSSWVASTIISEQEHARRVKLIELFVLVADECLQMGNFSTMMAVWRALHCKPVRMLRRANSEAMQSNRTLTLLAHLGQACAVKGSDLSSVHSLQEARLDSPCVPFLEGYMLMLAETQREWGEDVTAAGLINLSKARATARVVKKIVRHQHWRYDFQVSFRLDENLCMRAR